MGEILSVTPASKLSGNPVHRDVAKVFSRRESSNDRRVFGPKAHSSVPKARYIRGVRGHAPLGNFENAYSQRCIFLDFGGKIKGIQDRVLSGNICFNFSRNLKN